MVHYGGALYNMCNFKQIFVTGMVLGGILT